MNLLSPAPRAVQRALPPRGSSGVFAAPPRGRGCRRAVATRASSGPTPRGARSPARPVVPHSLGGYHCRVFSGEATAPGGLLDPDDLLSQPLRVGARRVAPVFTCEQVMEPVTTCFTPNTPMREVIEEFVRAENVSGFPVCDEENKLVGLITLQDIMWHEAMQEIINREKGHLTEDEKKIAEDPRKVSADATFMLGTVSNSMTVSPTVATPAMLVSEAAAQMLAHQVTRLPVVATKGAKEGQVVGILTRQNIMRCIAAAWI